MRHTTRLATLSAGALTLVLGLASCSFITGAGDSTPANDDNSANVQESESSSEGLEILSKEDAQERLLAAVCPTDSALQILQNVSLSAGGWDKVRPKDVRPYAQAAIEAVKRTTKVLQESTGWPETISTNIPEMSVEYV
jgi:hypothetical protein